MLVGASVLIPLILAYTAYAYWVFRGKIDPRGGVSLMAGGGHDAQGRARDPLRRAAWFVGLWAASVAAVGAVAQAIRLWLGLGL